MKISIVTPVFNGEKHIRETIESVISQKGDFEIEYILKDGLSTDGTLEIIKSYDQKISSGEYKIGCKKLSFIWKSEKDLGMYDAINKGFSMATGDIYAWINSDDFYIQGAFNSICEKIKEDKKISWIKGDGYLLDDRTGNKEMIPRMNFKRTLIKAGIYGTLKKFIPQETVFWKASLWKKVGGIDKNLKLAGDYYLWIKMAKYEKLYQINKDISVFRMSEEQLTHNMDKYRAEQKNLRPLSFFVYGLPIFILKKLKII